MIVLLDGDLLCFCSDCMCDVLEDGWKGVVQFKRVT